MAADVDTLIRMGDALAELPGIVMSSGPAVADAMYDVVNESARKGETPEGEPWDLTQEFKRALTGAHFHIEKVSSARVAMLRVRDHYALHDLGRARGGVLRRILPIRENEKISKVVVAAVEKRLLLRVDRVQ